METDDITKRRASYHPPAIVSDIGLHKNMSPLGLSASVGWSQFRAEGALLPAILSLIVDVLRAFPIPWRRARCSGQISSSSPASAAVAPPSCRCSFSSDASDTARGGLPQGRSGKVSLLRLPRARECNAYPYTQHAYHSFHAHTRPHYTRYVASCVCAETPDFDGLGSNTVFETRCMHRRPRG